MHISINLQFSNETLKHFITDFSFIGTSNDLSGFNSSIASRSSTD
jgi:hypothetical protein